MQVRNPKQQASNPAGPRVAAMHSTSPHGTLQAAATSAHAICTDRNGSQGTGRFTGFTKNRLVQPVLSGSIARAVF